MTRRHWLRSHADRVRYALPRVARKFSQSAVATEPQPQAHQREDDGDEQPGPARRTDTAVVAHVTNGRREQEYGGQNCENVLGSDRVSPYAPVGSAGASPAHSC